MRSYLVLGCYDDDGGIYASDISASSPEEARRKANIEIDSYGYGVTLRACVECPADSPYHDFTPEEDEEEHENCLLCECGRRPADCTYPETPTHGDN